jgi:hypothetical protein
MPKNLLPRRIITALKLSFGLWILGVIFFIPVIFFGFNLATLIKIALYMEPSVVILISLLYLKRINRNDSFKEGVVFGVLLVLTHLPSDLIFMLLFFKQGLIIFVSSWGVLFYGEMLLSSVIAGLLFNKINKSTHLH